MQNLFAIIGATFQGAWKLLTCFDIYGVNPAELCFAVTLLLFVIRKVIRPIFGGSDDDGS